MKALIFNSGIGKRMGELTKSHPKAFARLNSGETIFERQIRLLYSAGICDFVVTTGPFEEQFIEASKAFSGCRFEFVHNPLFDKTNYLYSYHLALPKLGGDILMLHGDLVFSAALVSAMLTDPRPSLACVDRSKPLPEKDFKALLEGNLIKHISVSINSGYAFQPLYKLSEGLQRRWAESVNEFVRRGDTSVYAENALNEFLPDELEAFFAENYFVEEVDTVEDLARVSNDIRQFDFSVQPIIEGIDSFDFGAEGLAKPLVVGRTNTEAVTSRLSRADIPHVLFNSFQSNPTDRDALCGLKAFVDNGCDSLISIGGGSAIDTAKGIKHFLGQPIRHISIPTTAGTGSESTTFAVLYFEGEKRSLSHESLLPDIAILEPSLLDTLPQIHKKATVLDALCQAVESFWSVRSTEMSKAYAMSAIELIIGTVDNYLSGDGSANAAILTASNLSGKAINISQTTAAHAMSYKITSLFSLPHGSAVALTLPHIWEYMKKNTSLCTDSRGEGYLKQVLAELDCMFFGDGVGYFNSLLTKLRLDAPSASEEDIGLLTDSVNAERLKNNPVPLDKKTIREIYIRALMSR